jgi:hypothetical protein
MKTFNRLTKKGSYTWNITHITESTAVWNLKPERWGSPLVQESTGKKRHVTRNTMMMIMIMMMICYSNLLRTIPSATYATPQNIQQFYMQHLNTLSNRFIQFISFLMMGPKHVGAVGFYNIIVTLIQMCALVGLNYSN